MTFYYETAILWLLFTFTPLIFFTKKRLVDWMDYIKWGMEVTLNVALTVALYENNLNSRLDNKYNAIMVLAIILVIIDKIGLYVHNSNKSHILHIVILMLLIALAVVLLILNAIISEKVALIMYIYVIFYYVTTTLFVFFRRKNETEN